MVHIQPQLGQPLRLASVCSREMAQLCVDNLMLRLFELAQSSLVVSRADSPPHARFDTTSLEALMPRVAFPTAHGRIRGKCMKRSHVTGENVWKRTLLVATACSNETQTAPQCKKPRRRHIRCRTYAWMELEARYCRHSMCTLASYKLWSRRIYWRRDCNLWWKTIIVEVHRVE